MAQRSPLQAFDDEDDDLVDVHYCSECGWEQGYGHEEGCSLDPDEDALGIGDEDADFDDPDEDADLQGLNFMRIVN